MRASGERTASCAYDIEIRWGGDEGAALLCEHVADGAAFVLVTRANSKVAGARAFVVDDGWLRSERVELVSLQQGTPYVQHPDGARELRPGLAVSLAVGPLAISIRGCEPELHACAREPLDARRHAWTFASLFLHAFALGCMALLPPRASSLALDALDEDLRTIRYLSTPVARENVTLPWTEGKTERAPMAPATAGEQGAAGGASGTAGRLAVEGVQGRRAVPRIVDASNVESQGLLGVLGARSELFANPSPYGLDESVGYDAEAALGRLYGKEIGAAPGSGLALRHAGRGGGGEPLGTIGLPGLSTRGGDGLAPSIGIPGRRREARVPRVISHTAEVRGSLSKEVIRRHIQLHLAEVRFCYAEALRQRPELGGRVSVAFLITGSGTVQSAQTVQSSLHDAGVEACVTAAIRRIAFPAPEGGGYVQVTYPFMFAPANG